MIDLEGANQRTLSGVAANLTWQPVDGDGIPADPGATVTVDVTNAAGTTLVTAGATTGATDTPRVYALAGSLIPTPDLLTAVWKVNAVEQARTTVEVVGGYLFTPTQFRGTETSTKDTDKYLDADIVEVRKEVEQFFEKVCNQSFVPTFRLERRRAASSCRLVVDRPNVSTVLFARTYTDATTYTAFTDAELAAIPASEAGILDRTDGARFSGQVELGYVHGMTTPPRDVRRAAMAYARILLNRPKSSVPDRVTSMLTAEGTNLTLATPGMYQWSTGYPDIDAVLIRNTWRTVNIK